MESMPDLPVKIDLGASAKLNVDIKADVPPEATGRLVDTLTKVLSPWAERRALKADHIRLQRVDVAFRIEQRARELLALEHHEPSPVPLKILVPLLEKGSQEEPSDTFMIDMWAHLLTSATKEGSVPPRFVGIIGELNSRQARLLARIGPATALRYPDSDNLSFLPFEERMDQVLKIFEDERSTDPHAPSAVTADLVAGRLRDYFKPTLNMGIHLITGSVVPLGSLSGVVESADFVLPTNLSTDDTIDYTILCSLDLLEEVYINRPSVNENLAQIIVRYYRTTVLGSYLLKLTTPPTE